MSRKVPLCPSCKIPVQKYSRAVWFLSGLATAGCLTWFVIGLFLLPFTPLLLLIPPLYKCKQCNSWWREHEIKETMEV